MRAEKEIEEELVAGLGSEGRVRILMVLAQSPEDAITAYALTKFTGIRREDVRKNLEKLRRIGWVREHAYAVRKYQINSENERVKHLIDFFKAVRTI